MSALIEYFAHAQSRKMAARWDWEDNLGPLSSWASDGKGNVTFRDPVTGEGQSTECWRVQYDWLVCTGFAPGWATEPIYTGDCIKAQIEDINTGLVAECAPAQGVVHYYAPHLVPNAPWRLRHWVLLGGDVPTYYEADFYPGETAVNKCWHSGPVSLPVIRQREVWWDARGGWVRGTGTSPFDANGAPIVPTVTKQFEVTLAKNVGVFTLWDMQKNQRAGCWNCWEW